MQEAVPVGEGKMLAVLGLKFEEEINKFNKKIKKIKVFVKLQMIMQKDK